MNYSDILHRIKFFFSKISMEAQKILDIQNNPEQKKISGGGILTISFRLCYSNKTRMLVAQNGHGD